MLAPRYEVIRADEIDDEGLITNQIIEHLLDDDLVIADLTDLNPNVFYEVAVRHAARKPIVHLITRGQEIPFDVANMRAISYALDDPDVLEQAQAELDRKVRAIEDNEWKAAPNPISAAQDVWLLRESEQPDVRATGELLGAFGDLRDEVRSLGRRMRASEEEVRTPSSLRKLVVEEVTKHEPLDERDLAERLPIPPRLVRPLVDELLAQKEIHLIDGKLTLIPF